MFEETIQNLANDDLGRTKALTEKFERRELILFARILIMKSLLEREGSSVDPEIHK